MFLHQSVILYREGCLSQHALGRGCLLRQSVSLWSCGFRPFFETTLLWVSAQGLSARGVGTGPPRTSSGTPRSDSDNPPEMTIEVGTTHPTGMHSCSNTILNTNFGIDNYSEMTG